MRASVRRVFPDDLIGKPALELFDPDSQALVRERIRVDSETVPLVEVRIVRLDGTSVEAEATASPFLGQGVKAIQVLLRDITGRKQAENELRHRTEDLERSNAELEKFAYIASHDLQEPLRIQLHAAAPASLPGSAGRRRRRVHRLRGGWCDAHATLINELLTYSRVGTQGGRFLLTSLDVVLDDVLRGLEVALLEGDAVVTRDPLPEVWCDPIQIGCVFQSLIANAVKFRGSDSPKIHVGARLQDDEWLFCVEDNGIGIESDYFDRIFVIFQRLQSRVEHEGTGTGLAICKRIIERHGGRTWVESQPGAGAGSTF